MSTRPALYVLPNLDQNTALVLWRDEAWILNSMGSHTAQRVHGWLVVAVKRALTNHRVFVFEYNKQRHFGDCFCLVWAVYALCRVHPSSDVRTCFPSQASDEAELEEILDFMKVHVVRKHRRLFSHFLINELGLNPKDVTNIVSHTVMPFVA